MHPRFAHVSAVTLILALLPPSPAAESPAPPAVASPNSSPANPAPSQPAPNGPASPAPTPPPFGFETVQRMAQQRSMSAYRDRSSPLPERFTKLSLEQYEDIRFLPEHALWRNRGLFEVQFFHRGFAYDRRVNINDVEPDGSLYPVKYDPADFDFGHNRPPTALPSDLGFAGFRVHYPLQTPGYKDEVIVFLGASYFRVLGRNESYGASARGLAVNVATSGGEEFPYFSDFWLVRPAPEQRTLTVYALLDSPSLTGAYHFEIRPGASTDVEVTATLYERVPVSKLGIAPLTSMYLYGAEGARQFDDFRPQVHDSDGLMEQTGSGEWLWRPLENPHALQVSSFSDEHPRGFGLNQRDRTFGDYQDEQAQYQRRPSYWVTPLGDWNKGNLELVEIPSNESIHDNIVAYWVSAQHAQPHQPYTFSYLLSAYSSSPLRPPGGAAIATRSAPLHIQGSDNARLMLVDFAGGDLPGLSAPQPVQAQITARNGEVNDVIVQRLSENGDWRVSFHVLPKNSQPVDLRCYLTLYGEGLTETWTYLWTP